MDDTEETVFQAPVTHLVQQNGTVIPNGTTHLTGKKSKLKSVPEETEPENSPKSKNVMSPKSGKITSQKMKHGHSLVSDREVEIVNNGNVYTNISLDDSDYEFVEN
jgi:hypothetical protein